MAERYSDTCKVINLRNDVSVDAEVLSFQPYKILSVSIGRSVKVVLNWNGMIYEGASAGMTFTSEGPSATIYYNQRSNRK